MLKPEFVLSQLSDGAPCFLCRDLSSNDKTRMYRVPVCHRSIETAQLEEADVAEGQRQLAALPEGDSFDQLRALLRDGLGYGLYASRTLVEHSDAIEHGTLEWQAQFGSIIINPPHEWDHLRSEFEDWMFEGVDEFFEGLAYGLADVRPFATLNFSPDLWFVVLRGPKAGRVFHWCHDDDWEPDEPWAEDIAGWSRRVAAEVPGLFGGVIRYSASDSIDDPPQAAELFPESFLGECAGP